jgi:hypothetical protein
MLTPSSEILKSPAKAITSQGTHAGGNITALGFFYANP